MSLGDKAKLGFPVPQIFIDGKIDIHLIHRVAEHADRFNFDSLWVQEQQIGTAPSLEPLTLLSSLANKTQNVKLGVSVLVMARHDPIQLAKQVASLDHLSAGRLILGLGAGSKDVSPGITGIQKDKRLLRLTEGLNVMKSLWTSNESSFQGKLWGLDRVSMSPMPLQKPHPPIFFGGESRPALRRVAELGQGWMGASLMPEDLPEKIALLDELLAEAGRNRDDIDIYTLPNQAPKAELFPRYEDLGVKQVIHLVPMKNIDDVRQRLDTLVKISIR